jgi:Ulp1 protease family, C-terminal catalytic domain
MSSTISWQSMIYETRRTNAASRVNHPSFFILIFLSGLQLMGAIRTMECGAGPNGRVWGSSNINNAHWTLLVIRMGAKTVSYYDSMNGDGSAYFDIVLRYLEDESKGDAALDKEPWVFDRRRWKCINAKTPQQINGYDCGVFVIQLIDLISLDIPLLFGQADMQVVRRRLLASIFDRVRQ